MACYMCICQLSERNRYQTLKNAMGAAFKAKNYITAAHICMRILELQDQEILTPELVAQYRKNYNTLQAKGTNDLQLRFDSSRIGQLAEAEGFLSASTLTPLTNPSNCVRCPYDRSTHEKQDAGKLCPVCELCKLGEETIGLILHG